MELYKLNNILKEKVIDLAQQESFVHHKWYVQYHLLILENLCKELFSHYPSVNKDQVISLMRIHDYYKITSLQEINNFEQVYQFLLDIGFESDYANTIRGYLVIFESKMEFDLRQAPIEVQIVSSCDAFSHYVGPFFHLYSRENSHKDIESIHLGNFKKAHKDWARKITLPEVEDAIIKRKGFFLDCFCGQTKDSYFT